MQYQLSIDIDSKGLSAIYAAGQTVTLVKSVTSNPVASGNLPVAWLAFSPLQTNIVTWIENYSIYASTTQLQSGATIMMTSVTPSSVQPGWTYTLQNGSFTGASGGGASTFNALNQMNTYPFNFGLAQQAYVNNVQTTAPLNAVPVLYTQTASFTPIETISVFLSSYTNNGVVISQVAGNALTVQLTSQSPSATIGFNDATNQFYLNNPSPTMFGAEDFAKRLTLPA